MQIRHGEQIFSREGDKREEQTQGEQHSVSLGAFKRELESRLKLEWSWAGSKAVFRSLQYMGKCIKWPGASLSLSRKKNHVPCSCVDRQVVEDRLWAKSGSVTSKSSAQHLWLLSQNPILESWASNGLVAWACLIFLLAKDWPREKS